ncbi:DUF1772 domain-containing protein [Trujillonella endophytica]|uniref:DUF1772 domain-containing protein n=1 Tax=Trujillonella endophytica TaxID=673521 RepID=A0A1H8PM90_9ACTN|nr:DUF1772 domain-containing protein [Trujillella endophytica]SEO43035.1 hypothetical protein SAMN05660991_00266 [Trujillella endophytica]
MTLLAVHLALAAAYAGFQWTVRALVYPQMTLVPPEAFPAYERSHQRRVSRVVGPLFAGQAVTTLWLLVDRPAGTPLLPVLASAACLAAVLELTALGAVPQHRRLDRGWDVAVHRRLVHVDTLRALTATGGVAAALWLLLA